MLASSSSSKVATTGKRPTNSGIKPYLIKSSGSTSFNDCQNGFFIFFAMTSAEKPIPDFSDDARITLSKPANAPPQINKILRSINL